jgi:hypothetical protein
VGGVPTVVSIDGTGGLSEREEGTVVKAFLWAEVIGARAGGT